MSRPLSLDPRPAADASVAVMVMSYNQGPLVGSALDSVLEQELPGLEVLMVDHASSDGSSRDQAAAEAAERGVPFLVLERHTTVAAARNAAIARTEAELVLPLDADNVLLPGALAYMRELLCAAPADVGFVYPRLLHFNDTAEWETVVPDYNLYLLLLGNYCDTGGLWDRRCFNPGPGFPTADYHEDWGLVLELGRLGVRGLAAERPTLHLRRSGFTRSQRAAIDFDHPLRVARVVPELYAPARFRAEKRRWAPGLSVVSAGERSELEALGERQTCSDFELVTAPGADRAERLAAGAAAARGGLRLYAAEGTATLLERRELVEAVIRAFAGAPDTHAVLLELGRHHPWRPLESADLDALAGVVVRADPAVIGPEPVVLGADPLRSLAEWLIASGVPTEARGWPGEAAAPAAPATDGAASLSLVESPASVSAARELRLRLDTPPLLPGVPVGVAALSVRPREDWVPRDMVRLLRFVDPLSGRRSVGTHDQPGRGALEAELGWLWLRPEEGTQPLELTADGLLAVAARVTGAIGHAETVDLTGLDELLVAHDPQLGLSVVSSQEDRQARGAEIVASLGYVEPPLTYPPRPRGGELRNGRRGLGRRPGPDGHRYALDAGEPAELELGLLLDAGGPGRVALHAVERDGELAGLALAGDLPAGRPLRSARGVAWSGAPLRPLRYRGVPRRAALGWRLRNGPRLALGRVHLSTEPLGWAWRDSAPGRVALYGAWHPVTADRLLTLDPGEALSLGYGEPRLLGHVVPNGPHRWGDLALDRPWAFRGGRLFQR